MNNATNFLTNIKSKLNARYKDNPEPPDCIVCGAYGDHSAAYVTTLGLYIQGNKYLIPPMSARQCLDKAKKLKGMIVDFSLRCVCATPYDNAVAEKKEVRNTRMYYNGKFPRNQFTFKSSKYSYNTNMLLLLRELRK